MARRLVEMLCGAGLEALQDTGVRGDRPRDNRVPDVGVLNRAVVEVAEDANLPGSAFRLVVEVVSESSMNGGYGDKAQWYAERGIPEYWIVHRTPDRASDDALVHLHRLALSGSAAPAYVRERTARLAELEAEYKAKTK